MSQLIDGLDIAERRFLQGHALRIGDIIALMRAFGNGVRRVEYLEIESYGPAGKNSCGYCSCVRRYLDADGKEITLKTRETFNAWDLALWVKDGHLHKRGDGPEFWKITDLGQTAKLIPGRSRVTRETLSAS